MNVHLFAYVPRLDLPKIKNDGVDGPLQQLNVAVASGSERVVSQHTCIDCIIACIILWLLIIRIS